MTRPAPAPVRVRPDLAPSVPHLRRALLEQRRFRVQQLAQLAAHLATDLDADRQEVPPDASDPHQQVAVALTAGAVAALADVDTALRLMQTGEYGRCRHCAGAIPLERLEVLPAAALCMSCQHQQEAGR